MTNHFDFQGATVAAQNEAMSARNAQLEIENESLKNELQNSRADYSALQVDMNDVRDYYHQIDIAASKMGHRCEVRRRTYGTFFMLTLFYFKLLLLNERSSNYSQLEKT